MRMSSAFPSKYLKAADLMGREITVTIDRVVMEDLNDGEQKPILYFQGKEKGVVLNKTNANKITSAYGDETDAWTGQPVTLYEAMVEFQGKQTEAIRIKIPRIKPASTKPAHHAGVTEDEIPFAIMLLAGVGALLAILPAGLLT